MYNIQIVKYFNFKVGYVNNLNFKMSHKSLSNNSGQVKTYTSISKTKSLFFPNI